MSASPRLAVAIVTETYPPEVNGVAMTLGRLAAGLAAGGHRVGIVRPRQRHEQDGPAIPGQLLMPGLPIPRYPGLRFGLPGAGALRRAWQTQRPDIVHVATEGPLGFSALAAARRLDIPVVTTFHTNFHSYSRHYGIGWLQGAIERYLRWFHNRSAVTLVPTRALADALSARGFAAVKVLARGVDTRLFRPQRRSPALRAQWGVGAEDLVVMVVGRLAPEKNLPLALRSFAALRCARPDARMVCVGDGPLREPLARAHPECLFVGTRQGEELAAHYASADLFLFPSLTETFGNVVTEALASGLPVVAYDYAAGSLIVDGVNGLHVPPGDEAGVVAAVHGRQVPPGDAAGFVAAACCLAAMGKTLARLGNAAPATVHHLDWENIHATYAALLLDVASRHPRSLMDAAQFRFIPD